MIHELSEQFETVEDIRALGVKGLKMKSHTVNKHIQEGRNIPLAAYNMIADWLKQQPDRTIAHNEMMKALDVADRKTFCGSVPVKSRQ